MRTIKHIVIHCTATSPFAQVESIQNHWRNVLKWKNPGYHYIIKYDGTVVPLLDEKLQANGVAGYNPHAIHISYIGGITDGNKPYDTRSQEQEISMLKLLLNLKHRYADATILGHNDFPGVTKACPSFKVNEWLKVL